MDLLVSNKLNPSIKQIMSVTVFGYNGGEAEWDILDRSDSSTWKDSIGSSNQKTTTAIEPDDLIKQASKAAGIIRGNSTVVDQPGKLEGLVVVADNDPANHLLGSASLSGGSEQLEAGDILQQQLISQAQATGPKVKSVDLASLSKAPHIDPNTNGENSTADAQAKADALLGNAGLSDTDAANLANANNTGSSAGIADDAAKALDAEKAGDTEKKNDPQ